MLSEHCATLSSSTTWPSTTSRVARTYHVICSLRPETLLRSVFLTYDHGYPAVWIPILTFEALPGHPQSDLHDGRSLTETVEHERSSPQRPPRQEFETKLRRHRYVTVH